MIGRVLFRAVSLRVSGGVWRTKIERNGSLTAHFNAYQAPQERNSFTNTKFECSSR